MQPSNQPGTSERLDYRLEELCWGSRQLQVATQGQNSEGEKAREKSLATNYTQSNMVSQLREKDYALKAMGIKDDRETDAPVCVPGVDLTDWLENTLDLGGSMVTQRNTRLPLHINSQSYQAFAELRCADPIPQQMASLRGDDHEVLERLCGPSLENGLLNVDTRVNRSINPSIQLASMTQDELSRVDDAMLNRISSLCMGPLSMQLLEKTLFNQSAGDGVALNASLINPVSSLPGVSNTDSRSSMDISPNSDLESVLLDSCGSGITPNQNSKIGDVPGSKKARAMDDLDSDSEGSYEDVVTPRKSRQEQGPSNKRIRASETHNESERKRRGRINEKLRALQELIPNANKTDKASVLTEAIDYLKKLRLQLQVMCCRNGLIISPLLGSQGVQNIQVPHVGADVNIDRGMEAFSGTASTMSAGLQSFPLASSAAAQVCSLVPPEVQFAQPPFGSTNTLISSARTAVTYGPSTNLSPTNPFAHPFQV